MSDLRGFALAMYSVQQAAIITASMFCLKAQFRAVRNRPHDFPDNSLEISAGDSPRGQTERSLRFSRGEGSLFDAMPEITVDGPLRGTSITGDVMPDVGARDIDAAESLPEKAALHFVFLAGAFGR